MNRGKMNRMTDNRAAPGGFNIIGTITRVCGWLIALIKLLGTDKYNATVDGYRIGITKDE